MTTGEVMKEQLCACGCGILFDPKSYNINGKTHTTIYIHGHNSRTIERRTEAAIRGHKNKEFLIKVGEIYRQKNSKKIKTGKQVSCRFCSKLFYVSLSRLKDNRGKFCSKPCQYRYRVFYKSPTFRRFNPTKPQNVLFELVKKQWPEENLTIDNIEYSINTNHKTYFIDVAIPQLKMGFEYDEPYWHPESKYFSKHNYTIQKNQRHWDITKEGWILLHFNAPIKELENQFNFVIGKENDTY